MRVPPISAHWGCGWRSCGDQRHPPRVCGCSLSEADTYRSDHAIPGVVRRGAQVRGVRRQCDEPRDGLHRRRAVGTHRPAQGRRRAGVRVLHALRQRQGTRSRAQSSRRAALLLGRTGTPSAHRRPVARVPREASEAYFATRPVESQWAAWSARQSSELATRDDWSVGEIKQRFANQPVPCPPDWGGFRVVPERIEFWQGRPSRLHDRLLYTKQHDGSWGRVRLAP